MWGICLAKLQKMDGSTQVYTFGFSPHLRVKSLNDLCWWCNFKQASRFKSQLLRELVSMFPVNNKMFAFVAFFRWIPGSQNDLTAKVIWAKVKGKMWFTAWKNIIKNKSTYQLVLCYVVVCIIDIVFDTKIFISHLKGLYHVYWCQM